MNSFRVCNCGFSFLYSPLELRTRSVRGGSRYWSLASLGQALEFQNGTRSTVRIPDQVCH